MKDEIDVKKAELQKLEEHKLRRASEWEQFMKEVSFYVFFTARKSWDRLIDMLIMNKISRG